MIQRINVLIIMMIFSVILVIACTAKKTVEKAAAVNNVVAVESEKHAEVDFTVSCMECHQEETPDAFNAWKVSSHGKMNFGCYMCHGDGVEEFSANPSVERCEACHSDHEECMTKNVDGCYDCHDGHSMKVVKN